MEAVHQVARLLLLLLILALTCVIVLGFILSRGPMELPVLAGRLASAASGNGIIVDMQGAELAWAGYAEGGDVPFVLRLRDISVHNAAGGLLASIPQADARVPPIDLFGGHSPILLRARAARFPLAQAPVSAVGRVWPGRNYSFARGEFFFTLGPGVLGQGTGSLSINAAKFTLQVAPGALDLSDGSMQLIAHGASAPLVHFSASARRQTDWSGTLTARLDTVQARDLAVYWPAPILPHTRKWVLKNISAGKADQAAFSFSLGAPANLSTLTLTNVTGGFSGQGLTLTWLQGAKPITGLNGAFTMLDIDHAVITGSSGQVGNMALSDGEMRISGLNEGAQIGALSLHLAGLVPDVLALLGAPPLQLLAHAPPCLASATGSAQGILTASIPFKPEVTLADIGLHVQASITNAAMPFGPPPLAFSAGTVSLTTNGASLQAQAKADFAGEPAALRLDMDFAAKGRQTLTLDGAMGPQIWHALGLDAGDDAHGPESGLAPFSLTLKNAATGGQTAALHVNLTPVALTVPVLAWHKAAGDAGAASFTALVRDGTLSVVQNFNASAPGLALSGAQQGNAWLVPDLRIGRTQASLSLTPPASPAAGWQIVLSGPVLDLRQPKDSLAKPASAPPATPPAPPSGPAWAAQLKFDKLYLEDAPAPGLQGFSFSASGRGGTLLQAQGGALGFDMTITPQPPLRRALLLHSADAGALLRVLDLYQHLQGGALTLQDVYGGGAPAIGNAELLHARFANAPDVTKLLQALTLYGVADAASGPGLEIDRAEIPFSFDAGVLTLQGARAYSSSLGFTASGTINVATSNCDLDTTIVPAYLFNAFLGRLPILGQLFSAEKGGGLIAMRAHLSGPLGNANVEINPLSALTPGFLRGIFGLGGSPSTP